MNGAELSEEQREKLSTLLRKHRDGLRRIEDRMRQLGWYTDDPVINAVVAARLILHAALHALPEKPLPPDVQRMLNDINRTPKPPNWSPAGKQ